MSSPSRIQDLIRNLSSDDEEVRKAAVVWLSQLHDPSVIPHLAKLDNDPSPGVRYFVRRTLAQFKESPDRDPLPTDTSTEFILELLQSEDPGDRTRAAMACYQRRDPALVQPLVQALEGEVDLQVIATLVKAVGVQRDPAVIPRLLDMLHHTDSRVRSNTVDAAMLVDDPEIIESIALMASDSNARVRASVALFLAYRDPQKVPAMIKEMIETDLLWMKASAVYVMHALGAPWCVRILDAMAAREDENPDLLHKIEVARNQLREKLANTSGAIHLPPRPKPVEDPHADLLKEGPDTAEEVPGASPGGGAASPAPVATASQGVGSSEGPGPDPEPAAPPALDPRMRNKALSAMSSPRAEVRLKALEKLKEFDDDIARERIELATGDIDKGVRTRAQEIWAQLEIEDQERRLLLRLGGDVFELARKGQAMLPDQREMIDQVLALGKQMERGSKLSHTVTLRDRELTQLGRSVRKAYEDGEDLPQAVADLTRKVIEEIYEEAQNRKRKEEEAEESRTVAEERKRKPGKVVSASGRFQTQSKSKRIEAPAEPTERTLTPLHLGAAAVVAMVIGAGAFLMENSSGTSNPVTAITRTITGKQTKKYKVFTLEEVVEAGSENPFKGRGVRWRGRIVERNEEGTRARFRTENHEFEADFRRRKLPPKYKTGHMVYLDGIIEDVIDRTVILEGLKCIKAPETPFERSRRALSRRR